MTAARPIHPLFLVALLSAAVVLRLLWQVQIHGGLDTFVSAGEATRVAMALAEGRGFADAYFAGSGPTAHLLPVNALLAGSIMALFGVATSSANVALLALSLSQVLFAYVMLARLFARLGLDGIAVRWGMVALCLLPVFVQREVVDFRFWEGALALGLAAASLAMLADHKSAAEMSVGAKARAMLLAALTFFVSPIAGAAVFACWGVFSFRTEPFRASLTSAAIAVAALTLFLGPWTIRNQLALGVPVVVRSNAGLELALANHDAALSARPTIATFTDRIVAIHPYHGEEARRAMAAAGGEVAYSRALGAEAKAWILDHPAQFLRLIARHARQLYFPDAWAYTYNESDRFNAPRSAIIATVHLLGLLSLTFGLVTRRRGYAMLAVYVLCVTMAYSIVQPITRYSYLLYGPMLFVAIDGAVRAGAWIRRGATPKRPRPLPALDTQDRLAA